MQAIRDEWTPFFTELKGKVSPLGRRTLLAAMIGDLQSITIQNFGPAGIARPEEWEPLKKRYADKFHKGDTTPKLILSGEMVESFTVEVGDNSASLTNTVPYADEHQFGERYKNLPARPYYPVSQDGQQLTAFAEDRLRAIVERHFHI